MNFSPALLIEKLKNNQGLLYAGVLWFLIWATYDTDPFQMQNPGFPAGILDIIHGLRSLLPLVAIIAAGVFLIKKQDRLPKNFFLTPLGLLGLYSIIGIVASIFSNHPLQALYWAVLYGSAILVLLAVIVSSNPAKKLSLIVNMNWVIAGFLSLALVVFFLIQPGVIQSLTYNFLICSQRPYEGLAGVGRAINTFGVAGTRPTGLARYAGVAAIVAFVYLLYTKKEKRVLRVLWLSLFCIFFLILMFSKGRTGIVAFIVALVFILCFRKKITLQLALGSIMVVALLCLVVFYNIPCSNDMSISAFFKPKPTPSLVIAPSPSPELVPPPVRDPEREVSYPVYPKVERRNLAFFSTLSGRTSGIWPESLELFLTNPVIGYGFQADRFFLDGQHAHNTLLQALIQTGLLGAIPLVLAFMLTFLYVCRAMMAKGLKPQEKRFLVILGSIFIFFVVRSITESSGAYFNADWLFLVPIIAYLQYWEYQKSHGPQEKISITVLGKKINVMEMQEVFKKIRYWITQERHKNHWIVVCGMHGIVEGYRDPSFEAVINSADISLIDGMSLLFVGRLMGFDIKRRIAGPDLMKEYFNVAQAQGYTTFFLGDTQDTLEKLAKKTLKDFPALQIVGTYSPPFGKFTAQENDKMIEIINQKKPDVLWVAFNLKKQEEWIYYNRQQLDVAVVIGVGAAFKFLSGKVRRAPLWIRNAGFEWLWRFANEPKVIWRRVVIDIPIFLWLMAKDFRS